VIADDDAVQLADRMHAAAIWMATQAPDLLTAEFRIEDRKGRVFLDWLRNRPGQTAVAPWSLRARTGAPAAVPLRWEELATTPPDGWTMATIDARLDEPDPLLALMGTPTASAPVVEALDAVLAEAGIETEPFDRFRS
jgi:bifunctional non-homologous end joining protein LigD